MHLVLNTGRETNKPIAAAAAALAAGDEEQAVERLGGSCSDVELLSLSIVNLNSANSQSCTDCMLTS